MAQKWRMFHSEHGAAYHVTGKGLNYGFLWARFCEFRDRLMPQVVKAKSVERRSSLSVRTLGPAEEMRLLAIKFPFGCDLAVSHAAPTASPMPFESYVRHAPPGPPLQDGLSGGLRIVADSMFPSWPGVSPRGACRVRVAITAVRAFATALPACSFGPCTCGKRVQTVKRVRHRRPFSESPIRNPNSHTRLWIPHDPTRAFELRDMAQWRSPLDDHGQSNTRPQGLVSDKAQTVTTEINRCAAPSPVFIFAATRKPVRHLK